MSETFTRTRPIATKGSQRWLQLAVNARPDLLDAPVREVLGLQAGEEIEWLSPLAEQGYVEYRDGATFSRLDVPLNGRALADFWPSGGPVWDGLARVRGTRRVILVEAKAHVAEMVSGTTRAKGDALTKIAGSLRAVQAALAPGAMGDWAASPFYQYANRIAHLHFLREQNAIDAHLVNVYFVNADDVQGPSERATWDGAIRLLKASLGLRRHRLSRYVHDVFVDVRDLADASDVGVTTTPVAPPHVPYTPATATRGMRLVAWNLAHQTRERPIPARFADAVRGLAPDLLVLNEYVHGATRDGLLETLRDLGLSHHLTSERVANNNQILIASRDELRRGDLQGPDTASGGGTSNFLHVVLPARALEVVGMRVPAYSGEVLRRYWDDFGQLVRRTADRPIVFLGDMNADPDRPRYAGGQALADLRAEGWRIPSPTGAWSYRSGSRIDHALAGRAVPGLTATYVTELGDVRLAGRLAEAVSDHAALVVDLEPQEGEPMSRSGDI